MQKIALDGPVTLKYLEQVNKHVVISRYSACAKVYDEPQSSGMSATGMLKRYVQLVSHNMIRVNIKL